MWDDYNYGLKPARIIALMYEHGAAATNVPVPNSSNGAKQSTTTAGSSLG
jgi:hypothetical protein